MTIYFTIHIFAFNNFDFFWEIRIYNVSFFQGNQLITKIINNIKRRTLIRNFLGQHYANKWQTKSIFTKRCARFY